MPLPHIGIEDPHAQVALSLGGQGHNQAVSANAEAPIAEAPNPLAIELLPELLRHL
jgi:hypothetical protein